MITFFKKLFGKKESPKAKLKSVEPVVIQPKPLHCGAHKRYKKSCPVCRGEV